MLASSTMTSVIKARGKATEIMAAKRYLDTENPPLVTDEAFPGGVSTNFYRTDDVSATANFYLDKPSSNLPALPPLEVRMKNLKEKVYDKVGS